MIDFMQMTCRRVASVHVSRGPQPFHAQESRNLLLDLARHKAVAQ